MAIAFLLAQFIGEMAIVYGILEYIPSFGPMLYSSKQVIILVHFIITVALVMWARKIASRMYREEL
jgi:hypothetical protein